MAEEDDQYLELSRKIGDAKTFHRQSMKDASMSSTIMTLELREQRMLEDSDAMLAEDPSRFLHVLEELKKKADSLTGEYHPLVRLFSKPGDTESNRRLEEGMKEYRKMIDGLSV
jgi:hypothetical protein